MGTRPFLVLLLLFLVVAPVSALIPDRIVLSSDTEWLTAGSSSYATITAVVYNGSTPLPAVQLTFALTDPLTGVLQNVSTSTDGSGTGTARLTPQTQSGDTTISVSAWYSDGDEMLSTDSSILQKIDHGDPKTITDLSYPSDATVGTMVPISLSLRDSYGNLVDDRRITEYVALTVASAGGGAGFLIDNDLRTDVSLPVDDSGIVCATLQLDTLPGDHVILIDPLSEEIPADWISIEALTNGIPHGVNYVLLPVSGTAPADGLSKFTLRYFFSDEYGNPAGGQQIRFIITHSSGILVENKTFETSMMGEIALSYGPVETIGTFEIRSIPLENPDLINIVLLEFHNGEPVEMLLTANPQMIASRDVNPDIKADIRAKVIDKKGHPVKGEEVTFSILPGATVGFTQNATLTAETALTDAYGYATVSLLPGDFTQDWNHESFNPKATGTATIRADWNTHNEDITITWKNYPFLSISTMVEPDTVRVNETVNVTIKITGDGWFFQSGGEVDVVQVIDSSGSMGAGDITPSRMEAAQDVTKEFVDQLLASPRNRVAIISSGSTITMEEELTNSNLQVTTAIDNLQTKGTGMYMRVGCHEAIQHLEYNARPNVVKAVILLGDMNSWNPKGNAIGDEYNFDNLQIYASDQDVKVYTVMVAGQETSETYRRSVNFSEATGGRSFNTKNFSDLMDAFRQIAEDLSHEAGVNTTMALSHENVKINQTDHSGSDVFVYIPKTEITNRYHNGTFSITRIDQTDDWRGITPPAENAPANSLFFDIGTIQLGQVWQARYQLNIREEGTIDIFDPESSVTFEDAPEALTLPTTYITAIPPISVIGLADIQLQIQNQRSTATGTITDYLPISWDLVYGGSEMATQEIWYTVVDPMVYDTLKFQSHSTWQLADIRYASGGTTDQSMSLDVIGKNGICLVQIRASAPGAPDDTVYLAEPVGFASGRSFIKIE